MNQPTSTKPDASAPPKLQIVIIIIFLGALLVALGFLIGLLLRRNGFQFSLSSLGPQPTATTSSASGAPTLFIPTADCNSPALVLGTSTFQVQNLTPAADGSLAVPPDTVGIAYWLEGTMNPVFVIPPTPGNMVVVSSISVGSPAKMTGRDCNSFTYSLSAAQAGSLDNTLIADPSSDGITIFFQTDVSGAGVVYTGELTEQEISTINTPDSSEVQAEIGLLETALSPDGTSIQIGVSIYNFGSSTIKLTADDVTMTPADAASLEMQKSEPRLPENIDAAETKTFYFTFPRPAAPVATLKIFTVEYDIEGY